jgi:hypothetical protein
LFLQVWAQFAADAGRSKELIELINGKKQVHACEILALMGPKQLLLRQYLFRLVEGYPILEEGPLGCVYEIDDFRVRVPPSASVVDAKSLLKSISPRLLALLKPLGQGGWKSALQKTIRYGAVRVALQQDDDGDCIPARDVVMATLSLLFQDGGSFSPELQLFTRGCTAAFKRLAIILVEDSWAGSPEDIQWLLEMALVCQKVPSYHPPVESMQRAMRLAIAACQSVEVLDWRSAAPMQPDACGEGSRPHLSSVCVMAEVKSGYLTIAAQLLEKVRSFKAELETFRRASQLRQLSMRRGAESNRPAVMPLAHVVDHHWQRGLGHLLREGGDTFPERFRAIFSVTG